MPASILSKAPFSSTQPGDQQAQLPKLDLLTRKANELARSETPEGMREAITVNAELVQLLKTLGDAAVPCFHEQMAHRLGIALSLALRLREDAPARARELLDAVDPAQKLIELDGVSVLRGEIGDIAGGRLAEVDALREHREALRNVEQQIRGGWAPNVHLGGLLSSGAWALRELRMRNHGHTPDMASTKISILKILAARDEPVAHRGLDFALSQNQPVNEGLDTNVEDVVREVWTYCSRHSDEPLRQNLIDAFVTRLRDIGSEQPCNTGCVQRLLQTMEGIDPNFEHSVPDKRALQEEITRMVAVLDQSLDDQIEIDRQAQQDAPGAVEAIIAFKQDRMKASIENSLIERRGLPKELVGQAMREPLDGVESNELMMADKGYADLDTGYRNYRRETALLRALRTGDHDAVRAQLERALGDDLNQADIDGSTALTFAAQNGHVEVMGRLLAAQGIEVNQPNTDGATALIAAARNGHVAVVGKLLETEGIAVNQPNTDGASALMAAARVGHAEVVGKLLEAPGIKVNQSDIVGWTALMAAARVGHAEVVGRLLAAPGIKVNQAHISGSTALTTAASLGHAEVVDRLLKAPGIKVNQAENFAWVKNGGYTALMAAAKQGHAEVVGRLLEAPGIRVNQQNIDGMTALMLAARNGHAEVVGRLLAAKRIKATMKTRPFFGVTAMQFAEHTSTPRATHAEIVEMLRRHGHETGMIAVARGLWRRARNR